MVLNGAGATDSSGNSVRVLLVDYRKDFDLIAWSLTSDNSRTAYPEFYYKLAHQLVVLSETRSKACKGLVSE